VAEEQAMKKQRRWTQAELDSIKAGKSTGHIRKKGRYGKNKRCVHSDGTKCDSRHEMARYCDLLLLQKSGSITGLTVHPRYSLILGGVKILMKSERYPNGRQLVYVADFCYLEQGHVDGKLVQKPVIEDVKMQSGYRTEVYKIKRALMDAMGLPITEV